MPYRTIAELPDQVKDNLPQHAQSIFKEAFNNAYDEYQDPKKRRDPNDDPEGIAFAVAWSAVEKKYEKRKGRWVQKD